LCDIRGSTTHHDDDDRLRGKSTCSIKLCQEHESDARQHEQLQKWQAKQQAGKNHENEPHGLEMKALSNCGD
jgi:hypothetical protein